MGRQRIILGAGQCGMKLADKYFHTFKEAEGIVNLSTSVEDSVGINAGLVQISKAGSGKKFSEGNNIWSNNKEKLKKELSRVRDMDVVYFTSAGGGSGSSSIRHVSDILLQNNNRVFMILVLPFEYEILPYKPNALQTISRLQDEGYTENISVMLFDNSKLGKQYVEKEYTEDGKEIKRPDMVKINEHIINTVNITLDLVSKYHIDDKYTPFSIDSLEHESVVFSNGFIGIDFRESDNKPESVKFEYGNIKDSKNVVIAKVMDLRTSNYKIDQNTTKFMDIVKKISRKAKNSRIMSGIIRTNDIKHGTYIIIGNNLDITKYVEKTKEKVEESIANYRAQDERERVLEDDEYEKFDI